MPIRPHARPPTRAALAGTTLVEVMVALGLAAILAAVAVPRAARLADRAAAGNAITAVASACALARLAAIMRGSYASVLLDTARPTVRVVAGTDTLLAHPLGSPRLTLAATRTTITYAPNGLGYGASNTTVVARQGRAADTLWTSRLGRVRH